MFDYNVPLIFQAIWTCLATLEKQNTKIPSLVFKNVFHDGGSWNFKICQSFIQTWKFFLQINRATDI